MKLLARNAALGTVMALVAVAITYFIADAISGPLIATGPDGELAEIPLGAAIFATVIGGIVGTVLALLVRKRAAKAATVFPSISAVALVLYGIFAAVQADSASTAVWLNILHIVAAIPIIGSLVNGLQQGGPVAAPTGNLASSSN